jgi:carbon-monoxide dehydrogenase large subunit
MRVRNSYIGQPMERTEDMRLLRGRGTYVADVNRPDQLYAVILRSSVAHGKINTIDTSRATQLPGVRHILISADLGVVVPKIPLRLQPLPQLEPFHQPMLADGKVRYVGEPIAVVLADTPSIAEDALDHIDLDIETLPAITSREQAEAMPAVLFEDHGSNSAITWKAFKGDANAAFASADYTRRETFRVQRHAAMFMEPRGFVAE